MNTCISRFGIPVRIRWRKYLNEYTHFTSVSLWKINNASLYDLRRYFAVDTQDLYHNISP